MALDDSDMWLSYLSVISMLDASWEELLETTDSEDDNQVFQALISKLRCV
jgi:hypothetical protein